MFRYLKCGNIIMVYEHGQTPNQLYIYIRLPAYAEFGDDSNGHFFDAVCETYYGVNHDLGVLADDDDGVKIPSTEIDV